MTSPSTAASLRLMADLKAISQEPPDGCSASPTSEENLFVWSATSEFLQLLASLVRTVETKFPAY